MSKRKEKTLAKWEQTNREIAEREKSHWDFVETAVDFGFTAEQAEFLWTYLKVGIPE